MFALLVKIQSKSWKDFFLVAGQDCKCVRFFAKLETLFLRFDLKHS